jgi:hypothetical protein
MFRTNTLIIFFGKSTVGFIFPEFYFLAFQIPLFTGTDNLVHFPVHASAVSEYFSASEKFPDVIHIAAVQGSTRHTGCRMSPRHVRAHMASSRLHALHACVPDCHSSLHT